MFLNNVFAFFQDKLCPIYNKSFFLQKIDWLIFANILFVILSSTVAPSDYIGYFAIFAIILTVVKFLLYIILFLNELCSIKSSLELISSFDNFE